MATRAKRRRLNGSPETSQLEDYERKFPNSSLASVTDSDRDTWQGFCEIESEPVCELSPRITQRNSANVEPRLCLT